MSDQLAQLALDGLWLALWLSLPAVLAALFASGAMALVASLTQWGDGSVVVVPRLLAVFGALALSVRWMGAELVAFTIRLWSQLGSFFA